MKSSTFERGGLWASLPAGLRVKPLRSAICREIRQNWLLGSFTPRITLLLLYTVSCPNIMRFVRCGRGIFFADLKVTFVRTLLQIIWQWQIRCVTKCPSVSENVVTAVCFLFWAIIFLCELKGECLPFWWFTNWVNKQLRRVWKCLETNSVLSTFYRSTGVYQ